MKRHLLVAEFLATPWALQRERLTAFAGVMGRWASGAEAESGAAVKKSTPAAARAGAISVLPLHGVIVQRANLATEYCGGTSTQQFSGLLRDAMADDTVSHLLIDIDSPGGSVYGVAELADEIRAAGAIKPIVGIANSLAASAAYWLGSACGELYVTPGGEVGSIGVWQAHEDWSKAMEQDGIDVTLISAGKFKVEGNPYQPLDDEARAFMQSRVDDYYTDFTQAVARGRKVSVTHVRDGMGQGRVLGADAALAAGMIDGIMSFDSVVSKIRRSAAPQPATRSRLAAARRDIEITA